MLTHYQDEAQRSRFELLPAIDLRGGSVVRLRRGDFDQETRYGEDPVAVAEEFVAAGAGWLHIVDLDAAREGGPVQAETIQRIVTAVGDRARCEVAGGLRTPEAVADALASGAARVVLGTAALQDPAIAATAVSTHGPEQVACALDVRNRRAVGHGWRSNDDGQPVEEAIQSLAAAGVEIFEVTAIERDGLLEGPDLDLLQSVVDLGVGRIIASGGITTLEDLDAVRSIGCVGAIIGRALYEGTLDLAEALARTSQPA